MFKHSDNEFDNNKLTNLDSITVNRKPCSNNELSNKKYIDDSIGEGTIVRFNQTLENYLKVFFRHDTYNVIMIKYKKQIQQLINIQTQEDIYYRIGS